MQRGIGRLQVGGTALAVREPAEADLAKDRGQRAHVLGFHVWARHARGIVDRGRTPLAPGLVVEAALQDLALHLPTLLLDDIFQLLERVRGRLRAVQQLQQFVEGLACVGPVILSVHP